VIYMGLANLNAIADRFTFYPGVEFRFYEIESHVFGAPKITKRIYFEITGLFPDVNSPDNKVPVYLRIMVPEFDSTKNTKAFIEHQLRLFWTHEFNEWFKLDGECVHEPHPESVKPLGAVP